MKTYKLEAEFANGEKDSLVFLHEADCLARSEAVSYIANDLTEFLDCVRAFRLFVLEGKPGIKAERDYKCIGYYLIDNERGAISHISHS